ncbi:MAG: hypothetical protein IJS33_01305 [Firmicutes bacterium]|nr:hypothetical protein [Bacillota bacterium]
MRKIIYIAFLVSLLLVVSACSKSNAANEITKIVNEKNIIDITVSTQMTTQKQDIVLNENDWGKLLDKLSSYSLNRVDDENENGWEYLFEIKQKDDVITLISFMGNRVIVNGTVYEVKDYNKEDFLYLFE